METDRIPRCVWWTRFFGAVFSCISIKNEVVFDGYEYFASTELSEAALLRWLNGCITAEAHKMKKLLHLRRGGPLISIVESLYQVHIPSPADDADFYKCKNRERRRRERRVVEIAIEYLEKIGVLPPGKISARKICAGSMKTIGRLGFHLRDHFMMTSGLKLEKRRKLRLSNLCREVDSLPSISEILEEGFNNITRETESLRSLLCNDIFRRLLRMVPERPESGLFFDQKPTDDEARPNWSDWRSSMEKDISF